MGDWQELIALVLVAAVVAFTLWYRRRRRRRGGPDCSGCDPGAAKTGEKTVRFHRRP